MPNQDGLVNSLNFTTTEIQSIADSMEDNLGMKGAFPKEHPKACCCCIGSAAVVLPKEE